VLADQIDFICRLPAAIDYVSSFQFAPIARATQAVHFFDIAPRVLFDFTALGAAPVKQFLFDSYICNPCAVLIASERCCFGLNHFLDYII
jgi:hypothetical protein